MVWTPLKNITVVNWDDEIPNIWENKKPIQTTNQPFLVHTKQPPQWKCSRWNVEIPGHISTMFFSKGWELMGRCSKRFHDLMVLKTLPFFLRETHLYSSLQKACDWISQSLATKENIPLCPANQNIILYHSDEIIPSYPCWPWFYSITRNLCVSSKNCWKPMHQMHR